MPLPSISIHGAQQCKATAKHSRCRCLNPAAFGMAVCRLHGARRPHTILKGKAHPNYRHGGETLIAKAARSAKLAELGALEEILHQLKMVPPGTKKSPGRKPRGTATPETKAVLQLAVKMRSESV